MLTQAQIDLLRARAVGPWPSLGTPPFGLILHCIRKPNPLSGASPLSIEVRDQSGRFLTWLAPSDLPLLPELLLAEASGSFGSVLQLLDQGAYKRDPFQGEISHDLPPIDSLDLSI